MLKLLLTTIALSFASGKATPEKKTDLARKACPAAKLKLRDCRLKISELRLQVWNDKISVQNDIGRSLLDLPLKDSEWVEVSVQELAGHRFLEFVAWDLPQGQGEVASKKWYVYEIQGTTATLKLEKLVQRRKKVSNDRYKYDPLQKYGLKVESKKVQWSLAREKGYLD